MNQKPIFLLGIHKSGTSLLRSLLNGHSQLYTIPVETHYFQNMHYWVDNEYRFRRPKPLSHTEIIEQFNKWIHLNNIGEDPYSDAISKNIFDEKKFQDAITNLNADDTDKARIEKYFEAIHYSVEGKKLPENLRIVEKSVENSEFAEELTRFFPEAQFIRIIRNPYANMVSLRKYKSIDFGFPIMRRMIRTLYNGYYFLYRNQRTIQNYYLIRYEDLVVNPKIEIQKLCKFLQIPFEDILIKPTYQSRLWSGNSMTDKKFASVDASQLNKWKSEITPMEAIYINKLFPFILRDFNYKIYKPRGSFWKRGKGENLRRYVANRLFKYYLQEWKSSQ